MERQVTAAYHRAAHPRTGLFVLERRRMDLLGDEKELNGLEYINPHPPPPPPVFFFFAWERAG